MTVSAQVRKPTFLQREKWKAVQETKRMGCPFEEWRESCEFKERR